MKKLMTLMGLAALSFSAFALTTNKVGFETDESYAADETVASKIEMFGETENAHVWYGASDDASVVKTYTDAGVTPYTYTTTSLVTEGPGDQFLSVEASSAPLVRSLTNYTGDEPEAQTLTGDVVADTLVQFTASEEMQTVDGVDGTKFALWLYADPEGETNLYVTAGSYSVESDTESVDAANFKLNASVLPGEWHRVTVRAIRNIRKVNDVDSGLGFVVYIDGTAAVCSDVGYESLMGTFKGALSTEAQILKQEKKLFLSLVNSGNEMNKLTGVGFKGTGYIDDLSIVDGAAAPDFVTPTTGFVLSWDAGVVSFTIAGTTYVTENIDEGYVIVTPTAGAVVVSSVTYDTANGYTAGTWTSSGADVEGMTFTLSTNIAEGMIVSSRSAFLWNGNDYAALSQVLAAMDDAEPGAPALIQLTGSFNASMELLMDDSFEGYDVPDGAVLDLHGQTLTDDRGEQASDPLFYVGGDFTIIDSVGGGKLVTADGTGVELFQSYGAGALFIGQVVGDEGATVEGSVVGATLVRGFFTDTTGATTAQGSVCSPQKVDGYWVVAPGQPTYTFTILTIAHTTYTYTVDGDSEAQLTGLTNGTKVVVTYAAAPGYKFTEATATDAVKEYTINGQNGQTDQNVAVALDCSPWSYSSQIVVWRATSGQVFHESTVADVAADGTIGDSYAFGAAGHNPWQIFASNQSAYRYPGATLVFDEAGYNNNSDAQFAPFDFGGMWVRALQAEGTPYCITDSKTDGSNRTVYLGATNAPCYFKFDESFTFNRNSATVVKGTATVEIAGGKTFTINARAGKGAVVESGNTLILKGAGTLAVTGGLTVNGTLDLSEATRPTIDGDVGLYGTIVLPAGTEVSSESPFTVCSGTLSGLNVFVKIGDAEAVEKSFTAENGAITSFGEPVYEFTENFPAVVPAGKTYTFVGGETPETAATVDAVAVYGTLKTTGYITLNGLAILTGGTLDVQDGTATATATTYGSYNDKQILGNIIVRAGATLKPTQGDFLDWAGATDQTIDIYGTLAMGTTRWSIKSNANCKINLYPGAHVTGTGDGNGVFDLIDSASKLNVYAGENGGEVVIGGVVKTRNANTPIWVAANTTLKIGGLIAGGVNKSGNGTLEISGTVTSPGASTVSEGTVAFVDTTVAVPLTVNAGKTVTASASEGVTVPLNVTSMATNANITVSGDGTVNGTVAFAGKPTGTLTGLTTSTWKGTISIPALSAPENLSVLTNCGNADSVISLAGITGNAYIIASGNTTYNVGAVSIDGATGFNNGSSGSTVNFAKISGTGALTLSSWAGCSSARYNLNKVEGYSGTLTVNNGITRAGGGTLTIGIGDIITANTAPGACVLPIVNTAVENPTGTVVYNLDNAKVNGAAANLELKDDGLYIVDPAVAKIGDNSYDTLADALDAVAAGQTITLLKDVALAEAVTVGESITIDGAHTISGSGMMLNVAAGKTLTLTGGLTVSCQIGFLAAADTKVVAETGVTVGVYRPNGFTGAANEPLANTPSEGWTTYTVSAYTTVIITAGNAAVKDGAGQDVTGGYRTAGSTLEFYVTPNQGYALVSVTANGTPVVPDGTGKYSVLVGDSALQIVVNTEAQSSDTYEVSGETEIGEGGSFTVPEGTTKVKVGGYTLEDGDGISINGTTVTVLAPAVVEEAEKEAIVIDDDKDEVTLNVDLVPGLYYGVGVATSLEGGINRPVTLQQYTGHNDEDILTVTKPEGVKGFFKVFVDIKQ